jgi:hypothetical protein
MRENVENRARGARMNPWEEIPVLNITMYGLKGMPGNEDHSYAYEMLLIQM